MTQSSSRPHIIAALCLLSFLQGTFSIDTNEAFPEDIYLTEDKRGGGRSFQSFLDEKRGGGRGFQSIYDESKRAGGRNFAGVNEEKRAGGRNFYQMMDEKRAGGRGFSYGMVDGVTFEDKRAGGRNFYQVEEEKRGGARVFMSENDKRGGGRNFQLFDDEKRGGGRSFQLADEPMVFSKRGGARPFTDLKRGGGRYFSGGSRQLYGNTFWKRGGARPMVSGFKRAGGRAFFGFDGFSSPFYTPTRHFYPEYTKKAPYLQMEPKVEVVPVSQSMISGLKRTYEDRPEPLFWTEKRAGGRTFPHQDEESQEK